MEKNLPYWKYSQYNSDIPYWLYRLPEGITEDDFVVFQKRLWVVTHYVAPVIDNRFLSETEAADPTNQPILANLLVRREQGDNNITVILGFGLKTEGIEFISRKDMLFDKVNGEWEFANFIGSRYEEHLRATERYLMENMEGIENGI
jgi:hypothetical protein